MKPVCSSPAGLKQAEFALRRPGNRRKVGNTARIRAISGPDHTDQVRKPESKRTGPGKNGKLGLSGVTLHIVDGEGGIISCDQLAEAIRDGHYWEARSRLVCLENSLNRAGGIVFPFKQMQSLAQVARSHHLSMHLDGARLWNASVASGVPEQEYAGLFDTVSVCLSKGLGAPVGSVFAGTKTTVEAAHHRRKELGGGMRQVGVLAAAGLYALRHNRDRLAEDHLKARRLAEGLSAIRGLSVQVPETNIVIFEVADSLSMLDALQREDVAMVPLGPKTIRATTHRDVSFDDIDLALSKVQRIAQPAWAA